MSAEHQLDRILDKLDAQDAQLDAFQRETLARLAVIEHRFSSQAAIIRAGAWLAGFVVSIAAVVVAIASCS